jgi:hypothetical protein
MSGKHKRWDRRTIAAFPIPRGPFMDAHGLCTVTAPHDDRAIERQERAFVRGRHGGAQARCGGNS